MRFTLQSAIVGSSLILLTSACGKRDQYDRDTVPANPDREKSGLVSKITPPNLDLNPGNSDVGSTGGTIGSSGNPSSGLSPAEIVAKVTEWNSRPIVWNESVGNIKIGETGWDQWNDEFRAFSRDGRVDYNYFHYTFNADNSLDKLCNYVEKNGTNVCTTTAGVFILQSYKGKLALPKENGEFVEVGMNERLDEGVYSKADREGSLIEGANVNNSTRGREFFKRFFNAYVAPRYTTNTEVDCFAEGRCRYQIIPGYYAWLYDAPGGLSGYLFITRDDNRLFQGHFLRLDSVPVPKALYSEGAAVDMLQGQVKLPAVNGGTQFNLGDSFANFQKIGLPDISWSSAPGSNSREYSGFSVYFKKANEARLADNAYAAAEVTDPANTMVFDQNFDAQVTFGKAKISLLDKAREEFSKEDHLEALRLLRVAAEKEILADPSKKGEILVSEIRGESLQSLRYGSFILLLVYKYEGKTYFFSYASYLKDSRAAAALEVLPEDEAKLMQLTREPESGRVVGIGPFTIGAPIAFEDLDLELTNRATINLGSSKVRVGLGKYSTSTVSRLNQNSNLPDLFTYSDVLTFSVGTVSVDALPCKALPNNKEKGYCVVSLYTNDFYDEAKVKAYATELKALYSGSSAELDDLSQLAAKRRSIGDLRASVPTCQGGNEVAINETKGSAFSKMEAEKCLLITESFESSEAEKTTFHVFDASMSYSLGGENNGYVTNFQFY